MASKISNFKAFLFSLTLLFAFSFFVVPAHADEASTTASTVAATTVKKADEKFNPGDLIMEDVNDMYHWHLWGNSNIPLPVIIYSPAGLDVFSSSHLYNEKVYHGKQDYSLVGKHVAVVNADGSVNKAATAKIWDISITKNVAGLFMSIILLLWLFISVANKYKKNPGQAPKGLQSFVEPLVIFVRDDIAKIAIGEKKYEKYVTYIMSVFFFIWFVNLFGIIPLFGANLTGNIAITFTLACFTLIITLASGNKNYWRHIFAMPGVPIWVLFILTPIEIIGIFLKPFVLMIRLFANMLAGHIVSLSFFCLIFLFASIAHSAAVGYGVSVGSVAFSVFMSFLDLLEAFIQAYVFALLTALYFGMAVEEHHEHQVPDEDMAVI